MRSLVSRNICSFISGMGCTLACSTMAFAADAPTADLALSFRPTQQDVPYELVEKADYAACKVEVERQGKNSGWVVFGPEGQVLRRFWDTNGDNVVDQWRYYDRGYEVYRDVDSNFNNKVDQSRWMNIAGTRWAVDTDEDGKMDHWKMISAEEASREAILAMAKNDPNRLTLVLLSSDEMKKLGIADDLSQKIQTETKNTAETMRARVSQSKIINNTTEWLRFDSSMLMPYVIPADEGKANQDLVVYENVMAIVETAGETGFVQMGELVQVGQAWKLTQIPAPIEGAELQMTEGGILMQPSMSAAAPGMTAQSEITPEMRQLLTTLQELDGNAPTPQSSAAELARYNSQRVDVLRKLLAASSTEEERKQWLTQMIDGLAAAVQTGKYAEGVRQLATIETDLRKQRPNSELIPYTAYRRLLAEYTIKLQSAPAENEEREEMQNWWLAQLKGFVTSYPKSEDAADALLQLAITEEFSGKTEEAQKWYTSLATDHAATDAGKRAQGALRRLSLEGKSLALKGTGLDGKPVDLGAYRGKAVLVIFWATWCQPCTEDLPQIKALYDKYRAKGFEIVGVNLDTQKEAIAPYINQHGNRWAHIAEPEGLEGQLAVDYGIISVPTMFLVNQQGQVVSNATSVDDLKEQLPVLLP
ncbi:thioredoxin-like domain-containing protein [Rubinisphaera italica]|uniref:Thiol-disulfide oxidoreductase ResA n=1 Tax=Rubinisphaera italica TaxID=2527969 RepID=A0A5C5XLR2_9PLAN|nr:thioredoxin-like domain-containing protein [Rubinisphaera italica]TWT63804.1 Thiol-disulfide oxidoreductase ResA [Rubinisphaera italica]